MAVSDYQCGTCGTRTIVVVSPLGRNNWKVTCGNGHIWTPGVYDDVRIKMKFKEPQ